MQNKIITLIPAREGSKTIIKKNIKLLGGYPLIAYSIIVSKLCKYIERTIVSTDSKEFAEISKKYGAEVPFLRPKEISQDYSLDIDFIIHAINWLKKKENNIPQYIIHLRPTTPLREISVLEQAIEYFTQNKNATSLRSVYLAKETADKYFVVKNNYLKPLVKRKEKEYYNLPRQLLMPTFIPNGYIDIIKTETIINTKTLHGNKILAFITKNVGEIDEEDDFDYLEWRLNKYGNEIYEYLKENF